MGWVDQGYGVPGLAYLAYLLKIGLYVAGWLGWCVAGGLSVEQLSQWWASPVAFQKAIVWSLLFEVLGLGCGSGPLTGRYWPPVAAPLHFLWPGTLRRPLWPDAPLLGGDRRGLADVALYAVLVSACVVALLGQAPPLWSLWCVVAVAVGLGVRDTTVFLAARGEHYVVTVALFAALPGVDAAVEAPAWLAGALAVQLALWGWAGLSKLNAHFPAVVGVMTSNGPLTPWRRVRRAMYAEAPDDLRPSAAARRAARLGTWLELAVPLALVLETALRPDQCPVVGLTLMVCLHLYILGHFPAGVPLEWNVMVIYGGFALFGQHPGVGVWDLTPLVMAALALPLLIVPAVGNRWPERVSFLLSMRYYAGNWPCSVWLFRDDAHHKLKKVPSASPWVLKPLERLYGPALAVGLLSRVMAFRLMHVHGRLVGPLAAMATPDSQRYTWVDGELMAGLLLGWNFGDGHLHDHRLLASVRRRCDFEPGELRCVVVESQPWGSDQLAWRVEDAASGCVARGSCSVSSLLARQPWDLSPPQSMVIEWGESALQKSADPVQTTESSDDI